jgi:hypothetical protein
LGLGSRIGRVHKQTDNRGCGYQIVQQAQSFWHQLGVQQSYAGEIATRPVQACHQAKLDRVTGRIKDDRNGSGRSLAKRRGRLPPSVQPNPTDEPIAKQSSSRQKEQAEVAKVWLTRGQVNAVRAATKAGIKPSQIARQFGISPSDVRKVLASDTTTRRFLTISDTPYARARAWNFFTVSALDRSRTRPSRMASGTWASSSASPCEPDGVGHLGQQLRGAMVLAKIAKPTGSKL